MKRLFIALLCMMSVAFFVCPMAEGASRKKVKKSEEQKFAEDPNRDTMRSWAFWNDFPTMNLEAIAAADANAALAEQTARLVSRAIEKYEESKRAAERGKRGDAKSVMVAEQKATAQVKSVAKEIIKGSRVAMSTRYEEKDGTHTCYVAVEISIDDILLNINNMNLVEEAMAAGEAGQLDVDSSEFEESMKESFQELKEGKLDVSAL